MKCHKKLDVVLLIDGSSSLRQKGWEAEKLAVDTFISAFEGKGSQVQISAILYSGPMSWRGVQKCFHGYKGKDPDYLKNACRVNVVTSMNSNVADVRRAVGALTYPKGSTLTSVALLTAHNELSMGREDAHSIVVTFTDGKPLMSRNVDFAANRLRQKARLLWVAVSRAAPLANIKHWATRRFEENLIVVKDFDDLKNKKEETTNHLIADICPSHLS